MTRLKLNRKGIEYGVLARDAASNHESSESLMQRTKETGISGELKTSNIRGNWMRRNSAQPSDEHPQ